MRRALGCVLLITAVAAGPARAWGDRGHELVNEAAARGLPASAPDFLRENVARLTYLGPEPDRWKLRDLEAMTKGTSSDHYIDLELATGVDPHDPPRNRYEYSRRLIANGQQPDKVGFGPYRAVEMAERLEAAVLAYESVDPSHPDADLRREQAKQDIIYVAGVLGHYVGDLANPHHTTVQFNGWKGDNPEGFATDGGTHARFESHFIDALGPRLVVPALPPARDDVDYVRAVWDLVLESNGLVKDLYRLDKRGAFTPGDEDTPAGREGCAFAAQRMARGAQVLRDIWVTAWTRGQRRAHGESVRDAALRALAPLGLHLRVEVGDDGAVVLQGRVDDPDLARRAVEAVRAAHGVNRVTARLEVLY
jgi:hypothetical protein